MAKTVSDVFLRLKVDGKDALEKLKGSFRGFEKTLGVTDTALEQIRSELVAYNREGGASVAVLKSQISALGDLQKQATIGGQVFRRLSRDVEAFERRLQQAEAQANATERAVSFRAAQGRFVSRTPGGLFGKVAQLQQAAQAERFIEGKAINPQYIEEQGQLKVLLEAQARIEARLQNAINATTRAKIDNNVESRTAAQITEEYSRGISTSANTTAQLAQRVRELRSDLRDLTAGSREYGQVLAQINRLEGEIADPFGTAARKAQIRGRLGTQEQFGMYAGTDPVAKSIRRNREKQARQAGPRQVPTQVREISGLYQQIGDIGMARTRGYIDAMGRSYKQVAADIRTATAASNGSINSLNSQRSAWTTLRNSLNPASVAYREVGNEIDKVDRKLARLNKGGRMGRVGRNLAAGAGGMLSGGIFGGPEGAIGGLAGGLIGGAPGAIAGAAIGAQVSQLRQQASGVAEFNAELTLAKKTLAQASTGVDDYNRLIGLARQVSSDYAVSLKPAVSGLAQIATAARANNLSFEQTEAIYRGLIASNVAFGKSQEDLDAIIRATVQVLSKGKVSAEELSGQIGERLPGAVAKFAAANNMSLPQLTEAFKKGEVTIAQFVRFARAQGDEYGKVAEKIAEGPEKAGLRLQIALENSAEIFGGFFAKVGAGSQDFFTSIVKLFNNLAPYIKQFVTNFVNGAIIVSETARRIIFGVYQFAQKAVSLLEQISPIFKIMTSALKLGAANLQNFLKLAPGAASAYAKFAGIKTYTVDELFPKGDPTDFGGGGGGVTPPGDGTGDKDKNGKKAANELARRIEAAREMVRGLKDALEISKQQRPLDEFLAKQAKDRSDFEARFAKLRGDRMNAVIEEAYADAQSLLTTKQKADLEKFIFDKMKGIGNLKIEQMRLEQDLNRELEDRKYELGLINEEEYNRVKILRERKRLEEAYPGESFAGKRAEAADLYRREVDPTFKEGAETEVARMERDLEKMTKPLEQLKGAAMAFGESISQAFSNIVTGSQTAQQAMAQFLKNLGQYFVEYAAKVITQMIAIATIQAVIKALGGPSTSGGGAGASSTPDISGFSSYDISNTPTLSSFGNAQGNAFSKGLKRYAMGGVVNKPTMFTYAEGGAGRFGLMGEAGPEAIIPLKRGNDGRLGVSAYFADANAAMAKGAANRSSSAAFEENADVLAMSTSYVRERNQERERQTMLTGAGGSMLIQTQVINNVEYATMDQVAQATAASAKQARAQVFADMRNKPSTRSSLGMR
jgi:tape measure domain-containing protein